MAQQQAGLQLLRAVVRYTTEHDFEVRDSAEDSPSVDNALSNADHEKRWARVAVRFPFVLFPSHRLLLLYSISILLPVSNYTL